MTNASVFDHTERAVADDMISANRSNWSIADAIVADIPDETPGSYQVATHVANWSIPQRLAMLADHLESHGLFNSRDEPYTAESLRHLRNTAIAWPEGTRHPHASFRTHQEASRPQSRGGIALAALSAVARGETVTCPDGFDPDAFDKASARVMEARGRFAVSANALRVAMERRANVSPQPSTVFDMLSELDRMRQASRNFADAWKQTPQELSEIERAAFERGIARLIDTLQMMLSSIVGLTDDELLEVLEDTP